MKAFIVHPDSFCPKYLFGSFDRKTRRNLGQVRSNTEEERSKAGRHRLWVDTLDHACLHTYQPKHAGKLSFYLIRLEAQRRLVRLDRSNASFRLAASSATTVGRRVSFFQPRTSSHRRGAEETPSERKLDTVETSRVPARPRPPTYASPTKSRRTEEAEGALWYARLSLSLSTTEARALRPQPSRCQPSREKWRRRRTGSGA